MIEKIKLHIEKLIKFFGNDNRLYSFILKQQKNTVYRSPFEKFGFLLKTYTFFMRCVAKVSNFQEPIFKHVVYKYGEFQFKLKLDLTDYTQSRYYFRFPDPFLRDLIVSGGDTFLDIGANIGIFSLLASKHFKHIHSFEPLPPIYKILKENSIGSKNISLHQIGLSSQHGKVTFYQNGIGSGGSSIIKPSESARSRTLNTNWNEFSIELMKGDDALPKVTGVDLIKIDVEGHEVDVMKGLKEVLHKNKPVLFIEIHDDLRFKEICNLLPFGYKIVDPVKRKIVNNFSYPDTVFFWDDSKSKQKIYDIINV